MPGSCVNHTTNELVYSRLYLAVSSSIPHTTPKPNQINLLVERVFKRPGRGGGGKPIQRNESERALPKTDNFPEAKERGGVGKYRGSL